MITVKSARQSAIDQGLATLDAEILLARVLERNRAWLYTWPDKLLTEDQQARFDRWIERRLDGEPVAHILGEREFWSLPIKVNNTTLIPRPDTETLVEAVLGRFNESTRRLTDLGTGTGAIALALASERPRWWILAIDRVNDAVELAKQNAVQLGFPVRVIQGHWCEPLAPASQDILVSNPPYICERDPHLLRGDVRYEPRSALVADEEGLSDIRIIAGQGVEVLAPGGWLFLEHGWEQGEAVRALLEKAGYRQVETLKDLGERDRVTLGQWPGNK